MVSLARGAEAGAVQVLGAGGKVVKAILLLVQAAALPPVQARTRRRPYAAGINQSIASPGLQSAMVQKLHKAHA